MDKKAGFGHTEEEQSQDEHSSWLFLYGFLTKSERKWKKGEIF